MIRSNPIKQILRQYPLFLLTIPLVFLVHTANQYYRLLHWDYIIVDLLIYLTIPFILYFLTGTLWRSYQKAGVLFFFLLLIFYFFHLLYDWLDETPWLSFMASYAILLPLLFAAIVFIVVYLHKNKTGYARFYSRVNIILILLLLGGIIQYGYLSLNDTMIKHDQGNPAKPIASSYRPCDTCQTPDIYFLIFDGYTNTRTLHSEFGYDNGWVENKLKERGFYIPRHSKSNYNFTHMSLGSELNLDYLPNLKNTRQFYTKDFLQSYYTVYHNELAGILRKQGYIINNYSNFPMPDAPVKITPHLTELTYRSVLGQTLFNKINRDIGWHLTRFYSNDKISGAKEKRMNDDIKRMNEVFNGIVASAKKPSQQPQFLYGHFFFPHETFYFDSSGNRLNKLVTARTLVNKKDYLNQLIYTNKFLMSALVDSVFKLSARPFIMIIQSDHGYRSYVPGKVLLEFENFSAIYFPDKDYQTLSDSLSSVNTYRIVLNKYFNQHLPILKDSLINLSKRNSF